MDLSSLISSRSISLSPSRWSFNASSLVAAHTMSIAADTSAGSITLTLPSTPNDGDYFSVSDATSSFGTNPLLFSSPVFPIGAVTSAISLISGVAPFTAQLATKNTGLTFVFSAAKQKWFAFPTGGQAGVDLTSQLAAEQLARTSADTALGQSITQLTTQVNTNTAAISATQAGSAPFAYATAAKTLVAYSNNIADTRLQSFTLTLPSSPALGSWVTISDAYASFASKPVTINFNGAAVNDSKGVLTVTSSGSSSSSMVTMFVGAGSNGSIATCSTNNMKLTFIYNANNTNTWDVLSYS